MFAEERIRKIKEILLEYEHVDINTLTLLLNASVTTVRRDLDRLESEGFLKKAHGGAVLNKPESELELHGMFDPHQEENAQVARLAAQYVEPGDVLFLGAGTICTQIARQIKTKKGVQVVTNSLTVAGELATSAFIKLFVTGGEVDTTKPFSALAGSATLEQLSRYFFRKVFLTLDGISLERGYTHNSDGEIAAFRMLSERSQEIILVANYASFGTVGFLPVCKLDEIKTVFTNAKIPPAYKAYYLEHGVCIYTSFDDMQASE